MEKYSINKAVHYFRIVVMEIFFNQALFIIKRKKIKGKKSHLCVTFFFRCSCVLFFRRRQNFVVLYHNFDKCRTRFLLKIKKAETMLERKY